MANKWQICINVNLIEKETLTRLLEGEVSALRSEQDLTADADEWDEISEQIHSLEQLQAQIKLAWIEKGIELIPPPSEWSKHFPVAVHSDVLQRGAPYPTREMKRKWHTKGL